MLKRDRSSIRKILIGEVVVLVLLVHGIAGAVTVQKLANGIIVSLETGKIRLLACDERTIRVTFTAGDTFSQRPSLAVNKTWAPCPWRLEESASAAVLLTAKVAAEVNLANGAVSFRNARGETVLRQPAPSSNDITAARIPGETAYHILQKFLLSPEESIYGLGQHQDGRLDRRNGNTVLIQCNRDVAVPFLVSTKNYGLLWDNTSHSEFHDGPDSTWLWSEVADEVDYYFILGASLSDVIAGYREATGRAPLFPRWAFGYWQSKERYHTQEELLSVAAEYRTRKIPIDALVQDWQYWGKLGWNAMRFDPAVFPDPKAMIDALHTKHNLKLMISVWPQVAAGTAVYEELAAKNHLFATDIWNGGRTYDAYSPEARDIYWKHLNSGLFSQGVDGWWLDATEPEWHWTDSLMDAKTGIVRNGQTALGSSSRYLNSYPLMTTQGVYENQRRTRPDKRVVILTRSAFAGQQRAAAAVWSGDILANWEVLRRQIPAALNFCLSGLPYWTMDIGGFFTNAEYGYPRGVKDPAYRELYVRWFQFGAFCPIFRSHGTDTPREVWRFGEPGSWAYDALVRFDHLRYRLLPYIYSVAWKVTSENDTMMRALAMDFPDDLKARKPDDEYMFGPALLAAPVTQEMYHLRGRPEDEVKEEGRREVYLPNGVDWFDFWTGERSVGGRRISAPAPIDIMPVFVRAGSILPLGPFLQYSTEKPADPIELRVYRGADGSFVLYEDENDNTNYERGQYALIPLEWNEGTQTLTVGPRRGGFPGMLKERTFHVIWVEAGRGVGLEPVLKPDRIVKYAGKRLAVKCEK
jgi:alpha-D-xyloside xylohydrolase